MVKLKKVVSGRRYWASMHALPDGVLFKYWSDHRWPFYHGWYKQRVIDRDDAIRHFLEWIPSGR